MMPASYQMQYQGNFVNKAKIKPLDLLDWQTTVEVIRTYIGIMIVCALIHYFIELTYDTIRAESNDEYILKLADLFEYLDSAFLISAFIAITIKAISDTWGSDGILESYERECCKKNPCETNHRLFSHVFPLFSEFVPSGQVVLYHSVDEKSAELVIAEEKSAK